MNILDIFDCEGGEKYRLKLATRPVVTHLAYYGAPGRFRAFSLPREDVPGRRSKGVKFTEEWWFAAVDVDLDAAVAVRAPRALGTLCSSLSRALGNSGICDAESPCVRVELCVGECPDLSFLAEFEELEWNESTFLRARELDIQEAIAEVAAEKVTGPQLEKKLGDAGDNFVRPPYAEASDPFPEELSEVVRWARRSLNGQVGLAFIRHVSDTCEDNETAMEAAMLLRAFRSAEVSRSI